MSLVQERSGRVLVLRLDRPDARNALNPALIAELGRVLLAVDDDPAIGAVVVTATGDRAFCAGMDLRDFAESDDPDRSYEKDYVTFLRHGIAKPVIAAANGAAVAGGFELLLGCDLVVAADHARFGLPEVKRGLFAAGGGTHLSQRVPLAVALELTLTGDLIGAERAATLGLVNLVVPGADVVTAAVALAERIAGNGPLALKVTKRLVHAAATSTRQQAWADTDAVFDEVFGSDDATEGARAFVERREPVWTGH